MKLFDAQGLPKDGRAGPAGANGTSGANGPTGPAVFLQAEDGEDGWHAIPGRDGAPGAAGAAGAAGPTGPAGPAGPALFLLADDGEDGMMGPPGAAGSGTTTTSLVNVTPDTHPSSPAVNDDEFESGSTIDTTGARRASATAWTASAAGTAATSIVGGSLVMTNSAASSETLYYQAVPSGSWEFTAKVWGGLQSGEQIFLCLRNTSSNNEYIFGSSGGNLLIQRQTFVSTSSGPAFNSAPVNSNIGVAPWIYLRVAYNGTNYVFSVSFSGVNGTYVTQLTESPATWINTPPTNIVVGLSNQGNVPGICDWFRRTA